jgi:hypothetical protein
MVYNLVYEIIINRRKNIHIQRGREAELNIYSNADTSTIHNHVYVHACGFLFITYPYHYYYRTASKLLSRHSFRVYVYLVIYICPDHVLSVSNLSVYNTLLSNPVTPYT